MRSLLGLIIGLLVFSLAAAVVPSGALFFMTDAGRVLSFLDNSGVYEEIERELPSALGLDSADAARFVEEAQLAAFLRSEASRVLPDYARYLRGQGPLPESLDLRPFRSYVEEALSRPAVFLALMQADDPAEYNRLSELPAEQQETEISRAARSYVQALDIPDEVFWAELFDGAPTGARAGLVVSEAVQRAARDFVLVAITLAAAMLLLFVLLRGRSFWTFAFIFLLIGSFYGSLYALGHYLIVPELVVQLQQEPVFRVMAQWVEQLVALIATIAAAYAIIGGASLILALLFGRRRAELR